MCSSLRTVVGIRKWCWPPSFLICSPFLSLLLPTFPLQFAPSARSTTESEFRKFTLFLLVKKDLFFIYVCSGWTEVMPQSHSPTGNTYNHTALHTSYQFGIIHLHHVCFLHVYHVIGNGNQMKIVIVSSHLSRNQFQTITQFPWADKLLQR